MILTASLCGMDAKNRAFLERVRLTNLSRDGVLIENVESAVKVGDLVTGNVSKLASFGAFIGLQHEIDGLVHISQISEERIDKIKNVLKVGQEVTARVIKIDKADRRIGLSIKAANYSQEQLKAEQALLDSLKPGEDLVALQHAFDAADEARQQDGSKPEGQP